MPEKSEPLCFVLTGRRPERGDPYLDENGEFCVKAMDIHTECACRGLRRLPPGWTAEAVERQYAAIVGKLHGSPYFRETDAAILKAALRAALFPPPEPEPEPWMREAARTWDGSTHPFKTSECREALARHIAKHAGGAK